MVFRFINIKGVILAFLSTSPHGEEWLKNFDSADQEVASLLIDNLMLVGASEFASQINRQLAIITGQANTENQIIALFSEREIKNKNNDIPPFFPNSETGRAVGKGVQPVEVDLNKQDVGSEGIVAALITKCCKANWKACISHPGPDTLRENKVRKIVFVTDFIGSGRRLYEMLDAFEKVATIQSWVSYHLISFHVVCYSATELGLETLKRHPLRPEVSLHIFCPVIDEAFQGSELGAIKLLCQKYPKKSNSPFGFRETGSLIAFSHGIPNNAPYILHSSAKKWKPLFEGRSTINADIDAIVDSADMLVQNSKKILKIRNARKLLTESESELWVYTMLILNEVKNGVKTVSKLSARTQLPLLCVEKVLELASEAKWLTPTNSLTVLGRRELKWSKYHRISDIPLVLDNKSLYFPTQLRAS